MEQSAKQNSRIEMVDALRGFAVMAIIMVHNLEHFIFPVYPESGPAWLDALDSGVFSVVFSLFAGKAYAIFALLFGFTFYLQSSNARRRGLDFGYRFLWRLVLLAGFATLNAAFFPAGDVLLLFAVVRNWSDRGVLVAAVFFLLQPVEWGHYVAWLIDSAHRLPDLGVDAMYAAVAEVTKTGDFASFIATNIGLGQKASLLWAVNAGRFSQTAGLFLLGFYFGRKQMFAATDTNLRRWVGLLVVSALAFAPLYSLRDLAMGGEPMVRQTVGTAFDMWQKLAFAFVLVASFAILFRNRGFARAVGGLRYYGRMSLTNYISQSVVGAALYFPFGLYLAPHCGYALSLLVGIVVFVAQVWVCKWWLSAHRQGPLEGLWHKWTWLCGDDGRSLAR